MVIFGELNVIEKVTELVCYSAPASQIYSVLDNNAGSFICSFVDNLFIGSHMFARTVIANFFAN